jgi:hypothetical protein
MADLSLRGESGNIDWRFTRFPLELLDRLAAWQRESDDNIHCELTDSTARLTLCRELSACSPSTAHIGMSNRDGYGPAPRPDAQINLYVVIRWFRKS